MAEAIGLALVAGAAEGGAVAAAGAWIVSNVALVNAALTVAASAAYGAVESRAAKRKARAAYDASLKDREVMVRTGTAPQRIVYGRDRVSGPIVYVQSTGTKKEYLHLVIALAGHECDSIESIYFNDILLPAPDGSGNITSGEFSNSSTSPYAETLTSNGSGVLTLSRAADRITSIGTQVGAGAETLFTPATGYSFSGGASTVSGLSASTSYFVAYESTTAAPVVRIKKYLGTTTQTADSDLVSESGGKWTSAHRLRGICYLYVRLKYDQTIFGSVGVPNISCVIKGKKCWDPRSSTTVWTENAALIAADFLRESTWGLGATSAQVPDSELSTAANLCDETVTLTGGGATQKRYTFNGSFTSEQSPLDVLRTMASAMAGAVVWTQGRWYIRGGAYRSPTVTITADSLAPGSVVTTPRISRGELCNAVRTKYRDASQDYAEVQAPLVANATYTTQDGGRQIVRDMTLGFLCDTWRAQRLGKIELERARQQITLKIRTNLSVYDLAPTDTVAVTLARYGWSGKVFEVVERTWAYGSIEYTLRETASTVYDWNYGEATVTDPAPDTDLPNPYAAPTAPSGLSVSSDSSMVVRTSSGPAVSRAYVSWTASADQFVQQGGFVDLQWRRGQDSGAWISSRLPGDSTEGWLESVPNGAAIVVRVRFVSGRPSAWTYTTHTVNGIGAMPATGLFLETFDAGYGNWRNTSGSGELSVVSVSDSIMGGKALRIGNNSGDDQAWLIHDVNIPYFASVVYRLRVRLRRVSGSGTIRVGLTGVAADGATYVNTSGSNSTSSQHYITVDASSALSTSWTTYDGYISGSSSTGSGSVMINPAGPGYAHTDVRFVRPTILANYSGAAGQVEVDYIELTKLSDTLEIAPGAAFEAYVDDYDFAGSGSSGGGGTARTFTLTPEVDSVLELTATCDVENLKADGGASLYWRVETTSGGTLVHLLYFLNYATARTTVSATNAISVTGGVSLTFKLVYSRGLVLSDISLGRSIMRIGIAKR